MMLQRILAGSCVLCALFAASGPLPAQTQKIRISLSSRSNTNTTYYVAQAK